VKITRLGGVPSRPITSSTVSVWPANDRMPACGCATSGQTSGSGAAFCATAPANRALQVLRPAGFGIIMTINFEIDNILPPDGLNLLVLKGVAPPEVSINDIILGSLPFVLVLILGMAIIMVFPEIALWLPRQLK
jgi:TRAP-type C4-dicarboxylate transport system permease large subunit